MTDQQYRVIADRDKGDDPTWADVSKGDRYLAESRHEYDWDLDRILRIERPVPPTEPDWPKQTTQPGVTEEESMRRIDRSVGKLPSIADIVPGTTLIARPVKDAEEARYRVAPSGRLLIEGWRLTGINLSDLDPSTIRDVTPPPTQRGAQ